MTGKGGKEIYQRVCLYNTCTPTRVKYAYNEQKWRKKKGKEKAKRHRRISRQTGDWQKHTEKSRKTRLDRKMVRGRARKWGFRTSAEDGKKESSRGRISRRKLNDNTFPVLPRNASSGMKARFWNEWETNRRWCGGQEGWKRGVAFEGRRGTAIACKWILLRDYIESLRATSHCQTPPSVVPSPWRRFHAVLKRFAEIIRNSSVKRFSFSFSPSFFPFLYHVFRSLSLALFFTSRFWGRTGLLHELRFFEWFYLLYTTFA